MRCAHNPLSGGETWPGEPTWGSAWKKRARDYFSKKVEALAHTTQLPVATNRIDLDPVEADAWGLPVPRITWTVHPLDMQLQQFFTDRARELLHAAGPAKLSEPEAITAPAGGGEHLLGTCRMGHDRQASVINADHRAHDVPNLFIVDGSSFVTSSRGQPTMTIQALAFLRMHRALLIVNPASRGGERQKDRVVAELRRAGIEADAVVTEAAGHAARIAVDGAAAYDAIFTLGGDGTAMEVIGALAGRGPPVGILPGGTGNLLVRSLGIPLTVRAAVRALAAGREARIDLGKLGDGRLFGIGAGVGVDATMIAETPRWLKRRLGVLSYVIVGLRSLLRFDSFDVSGTVDGVRFERRASAILVANFGTMFRHLLTLGDGILHDDGVLNVCIFSPTTNADAARITWKMMRRDFSPDPCMSYLSGRDIEISTVPTRAVQADGELAGSTPLGVRVLPGAGRLLLPNSRGKITD